MEKFDIILLLGMRLYDDGTADPTTIGRVDKAAMLWKQGIAPVIVASGAQGYNETHGHVEIITQDRRAVSDAITDNLYKRPSHIFIPV